MMVATVMIMVVMMMNHSITTADLKFVPKRSMPVMTASSCNGHWDLQSSMGVVVSNDALEAEKSEIKAKSQDLENLAVLCSVLRMCGLEG